MFWVLYIKFIKTVVIFPVNREQSICEWQHCLEQNEQFKISFCPRKSLLHVLLEMEQNSVVFILIFII